MTTRIITGDALTELAKLPAESVHCCVTSPPYFGLRDYGCAGQLGLEATPDEYVAAMVAVFREVRRVLRSDGTLWIVIGDSYAGSWGAQSRRITESDEPSWHSSQIKNHPKRASNTGSIRQAGLKPKDLIGIPWMLAFALRADGWWLRQDIIWSKPNPMPESVTDRCTKAHEYLFLLSKSERYYFDAAVISEKSAFPVPEERAVSGDYSVDSGRNDGGEHRSGGFVTSATRNKRSVWTITTEPNPFAHFAMMPTKLIEPCIMAGCTVGGTVLDPFAGAGTTGLVADRLGRDAIMIELNPTYADMAWRRIAEDAGMFFQAAE